MNDEGPVPGRPTLVIEIAVLCKGNDINIPRAGAVEFINAMKEMYDIIFIGCDHVIPQHGVAELIKNASQRVHNVNATDAAPYCSLKATGCDRETTVIVHHDADAWDTDDRENILIVGLASPRDRLDIVLLNVCMSLRDVSDTIRTNIAGDDIPSMLATCRRGILQHRHVDAVIWRVRLHPRCTDHEDKLKAQLEALGGNVRIATADEYADDAWVPPLNCTYVITICRGQSMQNSQATSLGGPRWVSPRWVAECDRTWGGAVLLQSGLRVFEPLLACDAWAAPPEVPEVPEDEEMAVLPPASP